MKPNIVTLLVDSIPLTPNRGQRHKPHELFLTSIFHGPSSPITRPLSRTPVTGQERNLPYTFQRSYKLLQNPQTTNNTKLPTNNIPLFTNNLTLFIIQPSLIIYIIKRFEAPEYINWLREIFSLKIPKYLRSARRVLRNREQWYGR